MGRAVRATLTGVLMAAGWASSSWAAWPGERSAGEILKELDGIKIPWYNAGKKADQAYTRQFLANLQQTTANRNALILELYRTAPDHERIPLLMAERWSIRPFGVAAFAKVIPGLLERPRSAEPVKAANKIEAPADVTRAQINTALERALPPLQKSLVAYAEKRDCFSCHNQAVPLVALRLARSRGLAIDEEAFQGAVALTLADLGTALKEYRDGRGQPGGVTRAGYALWTLETGKHQPDDTTSAVVEFLIKADRARDHWTTSAGRVPMEASHFTTTAVALRALRAYASAARSGVVQERTRAARAWLLKSKPTDTEDRVFRLWGLKHADASADEIRAARNDLLATQRGDGGWAQTGELASDAYATGSALVALHEAGGLAVDELAYRRGLAFLVQSQKADGTWFVASRSQPFQPYFESGFPFGKDQFIAVAASGWAAAALALGSASGP
jgi:hypothetical protein